MIVRLLHCCCQKYTFLPVWHTMIFRVRRLFCHCDAGDFWRSHVTTVWYEEFYWLFPECNALGENVLYRILEDTVTCYACQCWLELVLNSLLYFSIYRYKFRSVMHISTDWLLTVCMYTNVQLIFKKNVNKERWWTSCSFCGAYAVIYWHVKEINLTERVFVLRVDAVSCFKYNCSWLSFAMVKTVI